MKSKAAFLRFVSLTCWSRKFVLCLPSLPPFPDRCWVFPRRRHGAGRGDRMPRVNSGPLVSHPDSRIFPLWARHSVLRLASHLPPEDWDQGRGAKGQDQDSGRSRKSRCNRAQMSLHKSHCLLSDYSLSPVFLRKTCTGRRSQRSVCQIPPLPLCVANGLSAVGFTPYVR